MALSERQVDRFSRQIILPEVGGNGQERLLASAAAVVGTGALAEYTAEYLAAAGVGRLVLIGADDALAALLADLAPDTAVTLARSYDAFERCDEAVLCDVGVDALDTITAHCTATVAGGVDTTGGWFVAAPFGNACVGCATRAASHRSPPPAAAQAFGASLANASAGVIGSLLALAVIRRRLGLDAGDHPCWLQFDALTSMLIEQPLGADPACPICAKRCAR
jgi:hypothetical protein